MIEKCNFRKKKKINLLKRVTINFVLCKNNLNKAILYYIPNLLMVLRLFKVFIFYFYILNIIYNLKYFF